MYYCLLGGGYGAVGGFGFGFWVSLESFAFLSKDSTVTAICAVLDDVRKTSIP